MRHLDGDDDQVDVVVGSELGGGGEGEWDVERAAGRSTGLLRTRAEPT
jgi:hypothetical protein